MLIKKQNPRIVWKEVNNKKILYFSFKGLLMVEDAERAIEKWNESIEEYTNENTKVILVWDCMHMKNYEAKARVAWQNNLKRNKEIIDQIWLITNSVAIQAGAEIISYFTSFNIKTIKSYAELEHKL